MNFNTEIDSILSEMRKETRGQYSLKPILARKGLSDSDAYILIQALTEKGLVNKVRNGRYMITPKAAQIVDEGGYVKYVSDNKKGKGR
jgi:DNA-binding IclR family transcriptional regulator